MESSDETTAEKEENSNNNKGFQPLERINILKSDVDLSGKQILGLFMKLRSLKILICNSNLNQLNVQYFQEI